jgi:toxin CcdB
VNRQYDICRNANRSSRQRVPYLIVLQSDLLQSLATVVVAPVVAERQSSKIEKLNPAILIAGKRHRVSMAELAGVQRNSLGAVASNVSHMHSEFVAAIDLLFTGY